jgi:methylase of polypeptide subunit release factors
VLLPPAIFSVVQFFNGKRSIAEIQRDYKKHYQTHVELKDIRQIAAQAPGRLKSGGWLLLEHGESQSGAVQKILRERGFSTLSTLNDLAGRPRVTEGCKAL